MSEDEKVPRFGVRLRAAGRSDVVDLREGEGDLLRFYGSKGRETAIRVAEMLNTLIPEGSEILSPEDVEAVGLVADTWVPPVEVLDNPVLSAYRLLQARFRIVPGTPESPRSVAGNMGGGRWVPRGGKVSPKAPAHSWSEAVE